MKKILGLTVALASVIGFSSLTNVHAEEVPEDTPLVTEGLEATPDGDRKSVV